MNILIDIFKMRRYFNILPLVFVATLSFSACGVKNGYVTGEYGKYPLSGEIIAAETNDSVQAVKGTMSLLWQGDSLRITLNQGRQLLRAKTGKDTLYLYEAPRGAESNLQAQAANDTTRQYAIYLPARELFVIKYNDSLVYPVMPTAEPCEYPLERYTFNNHNYKQWQVVHGEFYRCRKEKDYISVDSTRTLTINSDGTWNILANSGISCVGILRIHQTKFYTIYNSDEKQLYLLDTTVISGHIHSLREMSDSWKLKKPLVNGEYYHLQIDDFPHILLMPAIPSNNVNCMLFPDVYGVYIEEGVVPCGWINKSIISKHNCSYE